MTELSSFFSTCFDKHSFEELNNIDTDVLDKALQVFLTRSFHKPLDTCTFFDIGCNAGSFLRVLQNRGITNDNIHCFEPHPFLSHTTQAKYPYVTMNNYCLSNTNGHIDLYIPQHSVGLSSTINRPVFSTLNQEVKQLQVACKTLDTYCEEQAIKSIDFVKIDVEGAEKAILEGASNLLKNRQIKCGLFEVGETLRDANTHENEICDMLTSYGYIIDKSISNNDYLFYLP